MGRRVKLKTEINERVGFKIRNPEVIDKLKVIAKREAKDIKELYNLAVEEYVEKHFDGNYQTLMGSFADGGIKSDGQLEQEIINQLKAPSLKDVKFNKITGLCREAGFKKDLVEHAENISRQLIKEGYKIWH